MDKIKNAHKPQRKIIQTALRLLLCAQETIQVYELLGAVSVGLDGQLSPLETAYITKMSHNLIVTDKYSQIYRFAHLSVKEFLEKCPEYSKESAHASIATIRLFHHFGCKSFSKATQGSLNGEPSSSFLRGTAMNNFRRYRNNYWGRQCRKAGAYRSHGKLQMLLLSFLFGIDGDERPFEKWIKDNLFGSDYASQDMKIELYRCTSFRPQPLFAICTYGFSELVDRCNASSADILDLLNACGMNSVPNSTARSAQTL